MQRNVVIGGAVAAAVAWYYWADIKELVFFAPKLSVRKIPKASSVGGTLLQGKITPILPNTYTAFELTPVERAQRRREEREFGQLTEAEIIRAYPI